MNAQEREQLAAMRDLLRQTAIDRHVAFCNQGRHNPRFAECEYKACADVRAAIAAAASETAHPAFSAAKCQCGLHDIPNNVRGVHWYWQLHTRDGCTLELPNLPCPACGLLRSEHITGHGEPPTDEAAIDAQFEVWFQSLDPLSVVSKSQWVNARDGYRQGRLDARAGRRESCKK